MYAILANLQALNQTKKEINNLVKRGIINYADAASQLSMLKNQELKIKKQLVNKIHITKGGATRKIKYLESRGLWYTLMPDKSKLYAKTEEGLYDKLFNAYHLTISDFSVQGIFEAALSEKEKTENNNESTISHYRFDFDRFITQEFAEKDIRKITKVELKAYTQEMVNSQHPKKKAYLLYKGVLNLIFRYAVENDVITTNPVTAIKNSVYLKSCDTKKSTSQEKILSDEEIECVKATVRHYMTFKKYKGYFINGYAILFSIETGCRVGEIPALKWSDVYDDYIHIHAQQLYHRRKGGKEYYYADWTKDEKGVSRGGRKFPLTDAIKAILDELKSRQQKLGIQSEYIFCHPDGDWIKSDAYITCLRRLMTSLDMPVINNHAFRMSLNSNVFIGRCNLPVTERARLLGHSVETNLRYYSYAAKDNLEDLRTLLNGERSPESPKNQQVSPGSHLKVVNFEKAKSLRPAKSQAF